MFVAPFQDFGRKKTFLLKTFGFVSFLIHFPWLKMKKKFVDQKPKSVCVVMDCSSKITKSANNDYAMFR
jgi:hypothetical protein